MGIVYSQLGLKERILIGHLYKDGLSIRKIGEQISRSAATVSREIRRNSKATKAWSAGYDGARADGLASRRRRWDGRFKLMRQPDLQAHVKNRLAMGWSPMQIAGRLTRESSSMSISHESIYRFIEHCVGIKDYSWHRLLPKGKYYRGRRPKSGGPPSKTFKYYVSIDARPSDVASRDTPGHWESDLMAFKQNKQVMLIAQERLSRKIYAHKQPNKGAEAVRDSLCKTLKSLPKPMRQTITYDNGSEFARHHEINRIIGTKSYFCHTHSPWQKGGIENAIGRLRRSLPSKTDIDAMSKNEIQAIIAKYNNTPRLCLGYLTPNEVFDNISALSTVALQT